MSNMQSITISDNRNDNREFQLRNISTLLFCIFETTNFLGCSG